MKKVHITSCLVASILIGVSLGFGSCRGSGGKKIATETMEFLEKEAGSLERNVGRIEKGAASMGDDAGRLGNDAREEYDSYSKYRKIKKSAKRANDFFEEDDEAERTPQPVYTICPQCQGNGMVYMTDIYGNMVFDYYGNPQVTYCPRCGGIGQIVIYQ